jgi:hypothetical protein
MQARRVVSGSKWADASFVIERIETLSRKPRAAGSREDALAHAQVRSSMEGSGGFSIMEDHFEFQRYRPERWSLTVDGEDLRCLPAICSISTPRSGLAGELCRSDGEDVHGKIVLAKVSTTHESMEAEYLAERGAIGALVFKSQGPLLSGRVRYPSSSIPCLMIPSELGERLWEASTDKVSRARMTVSAKLVRGRGTNIFATPRNAKTTAVYVAHRDSRHFSPGALDDASGTSLLLFLAEAIKKPSFALLSTDAEEYGLVGARHFASERLLDNRPAVVNLDSVGTGHLHLVDSSRVGRLSEGLNSRISSIADSLGLTLPRLATPLGSDCDAFLERGYQASWLRSYPTPTATTVEDTVEHVSKRAISQVCLLLRRLVGANLSGA